MHFYCPAFLDLVAISNNGLMLQPALPSSSLWGGLQNWARIILSLFDNHIHLFERKD